MAHRTDCSCQSCVLGRLAEAWTRSLAMAFPCPMFAEDQPPRWVREESQAVVKGEEKDVA